MKITWYSVSIFIFRLELTVREQLDENNFRRSYGIFFESTIWTYLIKPCSKFFRNNYKTLWQRYLKRYITVEDFTEMDHHMKIPLNENRPRCLELYDFHNNPSLLFEEHCTKTFHLLLIISEMSWCNVLLRAGSDIGFIFCCPDSFCYVLFTFSLFDILCILELIQSLHISYKNQ